MIVDEDLLNHINQSFVSGKISPTQRMEMLGVLIGEEGLRDHEKYDFDFTKEDIDNIIVKSTTRRRRNLGTKTSIRHGNINENLCVYQLMDEGSLIEVEVKDQIFQSQQTGNFFLEIERETEEGSGEYEISKTGLFGNSKNILIKYDLITGDDITTFQILVDREKLVERVKNLLCGTTISIKQDKKTRGYLVPISRLLYDRDIDLKNVNDKEDRYNESR